MLPLCCQQSFQRLLPVLKNFPELPPDKNPLRQGPQKSKANLILDQVTHPCSPSPVAGLGREFVAVVKALERPPLLHVGEVMVPLEFCDQSNPLCSKGKKRKHAKRSDQLRPCSGQRLPVGDRCLPRVHPGRRDQVHSKQFSSGLRGHDSRQIARVGKEQEHLLDWHRYPLLELCVIDHVPLCLPRLYLLV